MSSGYVVLPEVYDRWQWSYGKDYSTLILPRLLATLRSYQIAPSTLLDLACGTGSLALLLAQKGWRVWGVDGSESMIREARAKLGPGHSRVRFLRQDMRELRLPLKVDVVTCLFDSLNHLTVRSELLATFRAVHRTLRPAGHLIFDLNNLRGYKTIWRQTESIHHKDFTMILQNTYRTISRMATSRVTLFLRRGKRYERKSEIVRERYYPAEVVEELLRMAGFITLEREEFNFTSTPQVGDVKTWWVARRR
jgi:SAM-dependent methyltransferase